MGSCGNKNQPLYEEHKPRPSISCSLEPATQHLQNQNVGSQQPLCVGHPTINLLFVCRAILDRTKERVIAAVHKAVSSVSIGDEKRKSGYFCEVENMPLSNLTVASQAELTSIITAISYSGFSEMTHVHTSIPAAIEAGVKASNGRATRYLINSWSH